ncbi:hypothetical protein IRJ41_004268 [Triplophysa rosa]|uniref:Uncharacterized protein n=1 Tax=Triplophysa rosa TaxID=992332 RepID=A0A9W8C0T0_TRIRA|nr:hypothetical protein IRJ41_004268 [Triplophysa rosa]
MTPQHQPSPAGFELYTSNTGNEMPGVEELDHIEMQVKREGRAHKKPLLIKVATLNRSPSLEEEIVSWCPTSTVTKIPPIRAIKQVRSPEKHEETVTHKKPLLIQVATLNRSPSPEEGIVPRCPTSTVKKVCLLKWKSCHCPPSTVPTSVEVTESEGHTEVTYTEVQEYSSPPASEKEDKEESEDEIEVEILPWVEGIKQGQRKKIIDYASPPSTPKPAWMETERDPKIKDAAVVVESKTEVEEDVSTPSATEEHDSIEILNVPIARRQESLFVLPPIPKGHFIPLPDEREYLQRQNNTQEPASNANKNQQSFVNILTFKEWRDSRKRLKKEQKAKKNSKKSNLNLFLRNDTSMIQECSICLSTDTTGLTNTYVCAPMTAMSSAATTPPSVDKVDGFSRKSVRKAKQKRSQSSSQFRSQGKPIELTPLPLLKGQLKDSRQESKGHKRELSFFEDYLLSCILHRQR